MGVTVGILIIQTKVGSFSKDNFRNLIFPKVAHLVEESHEHPMIGARRNRGFQDVMEEVSEGDADSDGSVGPRPSLGSSKVIEGGCPIFLRFCSSFLVSPISLSRFLSFGAVGSLSGSSLSESSADASSAEILIASSARMSM